MWSMTLRYLQDEDKAMDVLNMGFLKVFTHLCHYEFKGSLEGWVRRIIYNTMVDFVRQNNRYVKFMVFEDHDTAVAENGPSHLYEEDLLKEIEKLPRASKEVFNLFAIEGYSHQEIAEKLGISEGTSKWHLSNARQILRTVLTQKTMNMWFNKKLNKSTEDRGWRAMSVLLDKELPENKRKRRLVLWLWPVAASVIGAVLYFLSATVWTHN